MAVRRGGPGRQAPLAVLRTAHRGRWAWALGAVLAVALLGLFVVNVRAHQFLGDDAFISFRYARNLADGVGLVYNPGERVEGYTNFLWVLALAAGLRLGVEPETGAVALGIGCGAAILVGLVLWGARRSSPRDPLIWVPSLALAASPSFTAWCSGGLETMAFGLLVLAGFGRLTVEREEQRPRWPSAALLGAASLTRPEGMLFAAVAGAFLALDAVTGRSGVRRTAGWAATYVAIVGTHLAWRYGYYGELLPNTFYARVPGAAWGSGGTYLLAFARYHALVVTVPLAIAGLALRRRAGAWPFAAAIAGFAIYLAYVGGDRFEFRMPMMVAPLLYALASDGLTALPRWTWGRGPGWLGPLAPAVAATGLLAPHLALAPAPRTGSGAVSTAAIGSYAESRREQGRFLRSLVEAGRLPADTLLCVGGSGALPYYSGLRNVDRMGLTDPVVARSEPVRSLVAHQKDVRFAYLVARGVVVFDFFNGLVYSDLDDLLGHVRWKTGSAARSLAELPLDIPFDSGTTSLWVVKAGERLLLFTSVAPAAEVRSRFSRLEILHGPPPQG